MAKKKPTPTTLRQSLEAALVANPDDLAAHSAYADHLIEQGDPRGEFIQVQLALEDACRSVADRKKLQKREQALLEQHQRTWLGEELAAYFIDGEADGIRYIDQGFPRGDFSFARGWLRTLQVYNLSIALIAVLARAPELRLLCNLLVDEFISEEDGMTALSRSPYLGNVRALHLSGRGYYGAESIALIRKLPRLEELHLMVGNVDTTALFGLKTLTNLRVLLLHDITEYPLEKLAANPAFARLTHLHLWPRGLQPEDTEVYLRLSQLRAVVNSRHLTSLTHLEWRVSDVGDAGCQEIVTSGVLKRLKVLELVSGCITDAGARILADCPDLRNLELLNVARNRLTSAGVRALKKTGVKLQADGQHGEADADDYRYEGECE